MRFVRIEWSPVFLLYLHLQLQISLHADNRHVWCAWVSLQCNIELLELLNIMFHEHSWRITALHNCQRAAGKFLEQPRTENTEEERAKQSEVEQLLMKKSLQTGRRENRGRQGESLSSIILMSWWQQRQDNQAQVQWTAWVKMKAVPREITQKDIKTSLGALISTCTQNQVRMSP